MLTWQLRLHVANILNYLLLQPRRMTAHNYFSGDFLKFWCNVFMNQLILQSSKLSDNSFAMALFLIVVLVCVGS